MAPVAVLVDAYTSGNYLPPAFARLGVDLVHVQSTPELMGTMLGPDLTAYRANLVGTDPAAAAAALAQYAPIAVVAGQEPGVPLADDLSQRLGLPSNGTALSSARRNKYEMIEALRTAGVRCAEQFKSSDAEAIAEWAQARDQYPVVVKPLASAATDGVAVCRTVEEVRKAAEAVLGSSTIYAEPNREVLVQSYLRGTEYVVDMVSYEGRRYTCGIWEYDKRLIGTHNIYDREMAVAQDASPAPELIEYVDSALAALGIQFGPSHAEVIVTAEGPTLVEVGARLSGNMHPGLHDQALGANQADVTALAYSRPAEFLQRYADRRFQKVCEAWCYTTPTDHDGIVDRIDDAVVAEIENLPTVYGLNVKIKPGGRIRPTVDLYTSSLRIFMTGDTTADLQRDYERIQELKDKVYVLR